MLSIPALLFLFLVLAAITGCAMGAERPESLSGQSADDSGGSTHFEWGGRGAQWGRVVKN